MLLHTILLRSPLEVLCNDVQRSADSEFRLRLLTSDPLNIRYIFREGERPPRPDFINWVPHHSGHDTFAVS